MSTTMVEMNQDIEEIDEKASMVSTREWDNYLPEGMGHATKPKANEVKLTSLFRQNNDTITSVIDEYDTLYKFIKTLPGSLND